MNVINAKKDCVGCGACVDCCFVDALHLQSNAYGFYEPVIDKEKCIDCSKCIGVCPVIETRKEKSSPTGYYGWNNDPLVRKSSTSGGAFSAFADIVLSCGGVVFGAKYTDDNRAVEMSCTEETTLDELRKSKYCQSRANGMYRKVAKCLKEKKLVMLTGTPCQIAAAKKYFGENENLILVDFLCGGVTPETAFANYINWMENKYNSKVNKVVMRDKTKGWSTPLIKILFENGRRYIKHYLFDYYFYYYHTPFLKNEQCMHCSFTQHNDADITIADFWGYRKEKINNDNRGLSLVCTYTSKGEQFLKKASKNMTLFKLENEQIAYGYKEKKHSAQVFEKRKAFLEEIKASSFVEAAKNNNFRGGTIGVFVRRTIRRCFRIK